MLALLIGNRLVVEHELRLRMVALRVDEAVRILHDARRGVRDRVIQARLPTEFIGSFSNCDASTSTCAVGTDSTRSVSELTFTVVVDDASAIVIFRLTATVVRTSMSSHVILEARRLHRCVITVLRQLRGT